MDKFICGICSEELNNILSFLQHKVNHVGPGSAVGCNLCQLSYTRQNTLKEHYRRKHRVNIQATTSQLKGNRQSDQVLPTEAPRDKVSKKANNDIKSVTGANVEEASQVVDEDENQAKVVSTDILLNDIDGEIDSTSNGNVRNIYIHVEPLIQGDTKSHSCVGLSKTENQVNNEDTVKQLRITEASVSEYLNATDLGSEDLQNKDISGLSQGVETFDGFSGVDGGTSFATSSNEEQISRKHKSDDSAMDTDLSSDESEQFKENSIPTSREASKDSVEGNKSTSDFKETQEGDYFFILFMEEKESQSMGYGKMLLKCLHCNYTTDFKASLSRHMKKEHPDMINLHSKIKIVMHGNDSNLKDQKVMKMSEYNAMQASERRKKNGKKIRGVETQDMVGNFTCGVCSKVFNRLRYLRKHVLTHENNQQFLCDECGKAFKTKTYLAAHRKTHKKEAYQCRQCDFVSSLALAIHTHRQIHTEGSVICDICGTAYSDKSTLLKHKQVHDMSRPYACTFPGCTFRFKTEMRCNAHIKNHSNAQGQFKCHKCNYVFRYKHHLKRHEAKKHGLITACEKSKEEDKEDSLKSLVIEEIHEIDSVNLIIDPEINRDQFNLQSALQNNSLVIATDEEGNAVNYEVTDIALNVQYHTLMSGTELTCQPDGHSMLIPQNECNQVIVTDSIDPPPDTETVVCSSTAAE
ncbi:zinc finger protein 490-like [Saccostrea echinata]|uniref:zinc finger protein 490-like n=1 Tax=Saccostrea echinata TaxID=191078 RepID=UPI002A7EDCA8|nr:zinc finger protein 490-like [Saccostrea echinata]